MKKVKLIFALLFLLGFISCKKLMYEKTSVKVLIIENISHQGVPNLLVELKEEKQISASNQNIITLKKAYTDVNGQVDFGEFDAHKNDKYTYYVRVHEYGVDPYPNPNIKKGQNNSMSFLAFLNVKISVKFIAPPPYGIGDSLSISITNANFPTNTIKINNNSYQPSLPFQIMPFGNQYINIDKFKTGVYTNLKDTVYYSVSATPTYEYDVFW